MKNTFGFIGAGNMGGALARAAAATMEKNSVVLSNRTPEKAQNLAKELGCRWDSCDAVARECGYIFLGVKPQMLRQLMEQIAPVLAERKDEFVLVSMIAGVTMADIQALAGKPYPVIRMMPNTPVGVGAGMIVYDATENVPQAALEQFLQNMAAAGALDPIPEKLINAASAVSGCGPAFVCMFAQALADGAVACGLPRDKALTYAVQTLEGTAKMIRQSGKHPEKLKDEVCSPGGSTIAGVRALEQGGFRAATMAAVEDAFYRTKELGK